MAVINPFDFFVEPEAEQYPFAYEPALARDLAPFLDAGPAGAAPARPDRVDPAARRRAPSTSWSTSTSASPATSATSSAWSRASRRPRRRSRSGAARAATSAGCWCSCCAISGFAARFVSGYLIQLAPTSRRSTARPGTAADFTDLHAWAEVYLPGAGWVGLDPTSGLLAGEGHIPLACTPEPESAAPITGAVGRVRGRVLAPDDGQRVLRGSARHQAVHRGAVGARSTRSGDEVDAALRRRRRAADDGRRADVRVDRRPGRRRVEHRGAGPAQARCWRARCCGGCRRASRRAACCTTARASGIPASRCRAGRSAATGATTASRSGTTTTLIADESTGPRPRRGRRRSASSRRWRRGSASIRRA